MPPAASPFASLRIAPVTKSSPGAEDPGGAHDVRLRHQRADGLLAGQLAPAVDLSGLGGSNSWYAAPFVPSKT